MPAFKRRKSKLHRPPLGAMPGTVLPHPQANRPRIDVMTYGPEVDVCETQREHLADMAQLPSLPDGHAVRWINVCGLGDAGVLHAIGEKFSIHPLTLEDVVNVAQRPKVEAYRDYLFIVTRVPVEMPTVMQVADGALADREPPADGLLNTEQLSICVGKDFVLTFQETVDDVFEPIRKRLITEDSRLRSHGADYLAYAIVDAVIDAFFPLLEVYGEDVEILETAVVEHPRSTQIGQIHALKRNLLTVRRTVWPMREMLNTMIREDTPFITAETKLYLRDDYDHTVQLIDMIETDREIATGLVDILLSSQSNRLNETMKVLTIIATIFIPLSFITGVYGMNFSIDHPWNMPELGWRFGYLAFWVLIGVVVTGLITWFWRKGWIGSRYA